MFCGVLVQNFVWNSKGVFEISHKTFFGLTYGRPRFLYRFHFTMMYIHINTHSFCLFIMNIKLSQTSLQNIADCFRILCQITFLKLRLHISWFIFNALRCVLNNCYFADKIYKCFFWNESHCTLIHYIPHICSWRPNGQYVSHHDDIIKWKHFPRYWRFVREIQRSTLDSHHKGRWHGALMFFFSSAPQQTFEQRIETSVIWDTNALIMTSM